jgi:hypothetical protein
MPKGVEHSRGDKKRPQFSLKEKRQRKMEKRAAKQAKNIVTPDMLQ